MTTTQAIKDLEQKLFDLKRVIDNPKRFGMTTPRDILLKEYDLLAEKLYNLRPERPWN